MTAGLLVYDDRVVADASLLYSVLGGTLSSLFQFASLWFGTVLLHDRPTRLVSSRKEIETFLRLLPVALTGAGAPCSTRDSLGNGGRRMGERFILLVGKILQKEDVEAGLV